MPSLDVNDALTGDVLDNFDVKRRAETVATATGRSSAAVTLLRSIGGVVCAASANDLDRLPEADRMGRNISVVTAFKLRGPSQNAAGQVFKPDIVVWDGDEYVVKAVDPYQRYGRGFVQAICGSVDVVDQAP